MAETVEIIVNETTEIVEIIVTDTAAPGGGGGGDTLPVDDSRAIVKNASDNSKTVRIDASAVSPNTTRTIIMPDADVDLSQSGGGSTLPVNDNTSIVKNLNDNTKQVRINAANVAPNTIRTITVPDADVDLGALGDTLPISDSTAVVKSSFDDTRQVRISATNVSPGTTRVITMPDANVDLSDVGTAVQPGDNVSDLTNDSGFLTSATAGDASIIDASGFNGNLPNTTDTVQKLGQAVDDLNLSGGGSNLPVDDTTSLVQDPSDNTKQVRIDAGGVGTGVTRAIIMPDSDVDLAAVSTSLQPGDNVSELVNDSGFITSALQAGDNVSELVNDSQFIDQSGVSNAPIDVTGNSVATSATLSPNLQQLDAAALGSASTGIISGGDITITLPALVTIAAGSGQIINNTDPQNPVYSFVSWIETVLDFSGAVGQVFIFVDATNVVQFNNIPIDSGSFFNRINLWAGVVVGGNFLGAQPAASPSQNTAAGLVSLWRVLGQSKEGFSVINTGNDLTVGFGDGTLLFRGVGFYQNPETPDEIFLAENNPVTFNMVTQNGGLSASTTILDVATFDDNGVVTAIPGANTRATIIQLHAFLPGGAFRFLRGQQFFDNVDQARTALETGAYVTIVPESLRQSIILGWVIAEKNAVNLSDGTQLLIDSVFNQRISVQSGGGSGGDTLPVNDTTSLVQDPADNTKQVRIDAGAVGTGTVRIISMPDADIDLGDIVPGSGNESIRITKGADDATSFREVTMGQFGTEYLRQSSISYVGSDRLINIGGGASDLARKDLLTVIKDGTVGVGVDNLEDSTDDALLQVGGLVSSSANPAEILAASDNALITKGFLNSLDGFLSEFFDGDQSSEGLVVTTTSNQDYLTQQQILRWDRSRDTVDFTLGVNQIFGTTQSGGLQVDFSATTLPKPSLLPFIDVFTARINADGGIVFFDCNATFASTSIFQFQGKTNLDSSNASSLTNLNFSGSFGDSVNISGNYRAVRTIAVILAGQSNMMGVDTPGAIDLTRDPRVLQTLGTLIRLCIEPSHIDTDVDAGVSPGLAFGKQVMASPLSASNLEILILPAAVNGSSVSEWINDDVVDGVQLLTNFTNQVNLAQSLGAEVKAVLWQQGEVDSRTAADTAAYGGREAPLMNQFRTIIGDPDLTIISGEIKAFDTSFGNELDPVNAASINSQKLSNANADANWFLTDSSDFVTFDGVHFTAASNRLMGQRMADVFLSEGLNQQF